MRWASSQITRSPLGRGLRFRLHLVGTGQHVEPGDQFAALGEGVAGQGCLDLVAGQDAELKAEPLVHFVLLLLDESPRRDDQATLQVATDQQLLD
jgi:hypothetical protein